MKSKSVLLVFMLAVIYSAGQSVSDTISISEVKIIAKRKVNEAGLKITRPDSVARAYSLTTDLSELISEYSPVFIKSYGRGSFATASFRGAAATHTQVLWNGINLNSPMRGSADLSLFPVYFFDDIYLLHGTSSMTGGSGALGGSVNIVNNPDWSKGFNIKTLLESGSFNTHKGFLKISYGGQRTSFATRLFLDQSKNDFPFYNTGILPHRKDTLQNAEYFRYGILQEFYFRRDFDEILSFRFWYQQNDRELPQLMSYEGNPREEYQDDNQLRTQFEWRKYSQIADYHFFSGVSSTRMDYYRATPEFNYVNDDSYSGETGFVNHLQINRKFNEKYYAAIGVDANYHQVQITDRIRDNGYRKDRYESSLFLNFQFRPSERLNGFLLVRTEQYDKRFVPFIPAAGFEFQFDADVPVLLRINAGRNYHKPALNDLYWMPGGNPDLLHEDGYSGDISLAGEYENDKVMFNNEITGFISKIENWILWQPASNGAYYWEADNIRDVFSGGIEYQYTASVKLKKVMFRSGGNFSFTSTSNLNAVSSADQSRGKQLIYIPKSKGNFWLSSTFKKITLKYDLKGVSRRFTKSDNEVADFERVLNPYWLSTFSVNRQIDLNQYKLSLKFTVDNIFDTNYQSILWRPMPGRCYSLSVGFDFDKIEI